MRDVEATSEATPINNRVACVFYILQDVYSIYGSIMVPVHLLRSVRALGARSYSEALAAAVSSPSTQNVRVSDDIKPFSEIPGPKQLPIIRNLLDFKRNSTRLIEFLEECYKEYGEIFKLEVPG